VKLDSKSKSILKFRPKIDFVEPEQEEVPIEPIKPKVEFEEIKDRRKKIKAYANALNTLAQVVQGLIDDSADGVTIELNPGVDVAAIQSMRRTYPDALASRITYAQFKQCEDNKRKHAEEVSQKSTISQDEVAKAREDLIRNKDVPIGGIGTPEAENGGLRPELDKRNQLVEPIDLDSFQDEMIKVFVNHIWKNFFLSILGLIPFASDILPDELVPTSKSTKKMMSNLEERGAKTL